MDNKQPFGGKVIVLAGNFRQLPTVLPKASRAQIVAASFKKSYLWPLFKTYRLAENMRILNSGNESKLVEFDLWLEQLGDGILETIDDDDSFVKFPEELCCNIDENQIESSKNDAITFTFGDIKTKSTSPDWIDFVATRAILATKNESVDDINRICLEKIDGEEFTIPSADSTVNSEDATLYPVEYINTLKHLAFHHIALR